MHAIRDNFIFQTYYQIIIEKTLEIICGSTGGRGKYLAWASHKPRCQLGLTSS